MCASVFVWVNATENGNFSNCLALCMRGAGIVAATFRNSEEYAQQQQQQQQKWPGELREKHQHMKRMCWKYVFE